MFGRGAWLGRRRGLLALLVLAALVSLRVPLHSELAADFPAVTPHALAHFLADFSNYPKLDPDIESWSVEEESGNYTWWSYSVAYACGARCAGRARLWHAAEGGRGAAPRHGAAAAHRLRLEDARCTALPLLPFLRLCDEQSVEVVVAEGAAGGSRLAEAARGRCGAAHALLARCRLAQRRRRQLDALRALLSSAP